MHRMYGYASIRFSLKRQSSLLLVETRLSIEVPSDTPRYIRTNMMKFSEEEVK